MVGEGHDDELRDYLNQIDQASQYLLSLLNNIMDMSKIESSKYEINTKPFDISVVLDEVYSVFSATMSSKGVKFIINTDGLNAPNVLGDELSLRKILNNLLSNANKFTKAGGSLTPVSDTHRDVYKRQGFNITFELSALLFYGMILSIPAIAAFILSGIAYLVIRNK